jgi:hypothetical protein
MRIGDTGGRRVWTSRNGRTAVVIVAAEEWERKRRGNLDRVLATSPLRKSQLTVRRPQDRPRQGRSICEVSFGHRDEDQSFISVVTLAELRYGISRVIPRESLCRNHN